MTHMLKICCAAVVLFAFSGCYTELMTRDDGDDGLAYADDSTAAGATTIVNNYYLNDDFRHSRLRSTFHYYYPQYTSWIGGYFNSYYNDPYWGFGWGIGYYDPYRWGCQYPYYDPWLYPYYPPVAYYPIYHPHYYPGHHYPGYDGGLGYGGGSIDPGRPRSSGPSRDVAGSDERSRPLPGPSTTPPVTVMNRPRVPDAAPVAAPTERRREQAWWERNNDAQPVTGRDRRGSESATPAGRQQRQGNGEAVTVEPRKGNGSTGRTGQEGRRREESRWTPSPGQSAPQREARPREAQRPSYAPPSSSAPSHSGGGHTGGGSSGGGRKRD